MKFLFLFLVIGLTAVTCQLTNIDYVHGDRSTFKTRNWDLVRLLDNVGMPNVNVDQVEIGNKWHFDDKFQFFDDVWSLRKFIDIYKGGLLPKYSVFSMSNDKHMFETVTYIKLLLSAKNYDTFYRVACWGRQYLNEAMFVYSLKFATFERKDCKGFILPPIYQIFPNFFLNADVINLGRRIKMQRGIVDQHLALQRGIYKKNDMIYITSNTTGWFNDETRLSYFTEDIGLNMYSYYTNMLYPFGKRYDERYFGDLWFFIHQQILARYYMERLSVGLGKIPKFSWKKPIRTGFMCNIQFTDTVKCPSRKNFYDLFVEDNYYKLDDIHDFEKYMRDSFRFKTKITDRSIDKTEHHEESDYRKFFVHENFHETAERIYLRTFFDAKSLLGGGIRSLYDDKIIPSALERSETALRDPMYYQLYKKYTKYFLKFKRNLEPWSREKLITPGIKIKNMDTDKLETYFDEFDVDMYNAIYNTNDEQIVQKKFLKLIGRQYRLNHKPFNIRLDLVSDKTTDVVIKIFLGPKYDSLRREIPLRKNWMNFFEIDTFVYNIKTGDNKIIRNSRDFTVTDGDWTKTRDMLMSKSDFMDGDYKFDYFSFPDRLVLPRGKVEGMPFQLFACVVPTAFLNKQFPISDFSMKDIDSMTRFKMMETGFYGFPFDRPMLNKVSFLVDNMFFKDVAIFHRRSEMDVHNFDTIYKKNTIFDD